MSEDFKGLPEDMFWLFHSEASMTSTLFLQAMDTMSQMQRPDEGHLANVLFDLSTGFERLLKMLRMLLIYESTGNWPVPKAFGHNLNGLAYSVFKLAAPKAVLDEQFFRAEPYTSILSVLTNFADDNGRYHNLSKIAGTRSSSPFLKWHEKVEKQILQRHNKPNKSSRFYSNMAPSMDRHSTVLVVGYDGALIRSHAEFSVISHEYGIIRKHLKVYVCHMIREITKLFDEIGVHGIYSLSEFFALFHNEDAYIRRRNRFPSRW